MTSESTPSWAPVQRDEDPECINIAVALYSTESIKELHIAPIVSGLREQPVLPCEVRLKEASPSLT